MRSHLEQTKNNAELVKGCTGLGDWPAWTAENHSGGYGRGAIILVHEGGADRTSTARDRGSEMPWRLEGTYFENCNCDMVCPCTTSGLTAPADNDRCNAFLVFHIDSGDVDGVDVSGLSVGMVADAPAVMNSGNWRVGLFMDAAASPDQAEGLGAVFSGQRGGPLADLAPLIGEMLGMQTAPIVYADDGRRHRVRIADSVDIEVEDFVSALDATGKGVRVGGVGFPADTLACGTAVSSSLNAFGLEFSNIGKNAFSSPFSWSA